VKDKLAGGKNGSGSERRKELLDELAEIRSAQGNIKQTRNKIFEQVNSLQEGIQKKVSFPPYHDYQLKALANEHLR
jgi:uncharacterized coiled-coil DUF342 family protein